MPTYEYECPACGAFAEIRPMAEFDQPQPCPSCTLPAPRRLTLAALGAGARQSASEQPARSHPGGCACCAPRSGLTAEAV